MFGGETIMQIRELIIYGKNNKRRKISFELGKMNIITGRSKSGKSAVGDIISYCLGGNSCNIADGVIREKSEWYGLLLQFKNERVFCARKNPVPGRHTTNACYIKIGKDIEVPSACDFESNTNVEGLEQLLSRLLGIKENLNELTEESTRQAYSANIRHALYYCFQNQDEIAAKNFLFHRQSEDFITQAIKDTFPYFIGIVNEETLKLQNDRKILRRQLAIEKKKLEEKQLLVGNGIERAKSLLAEAYHSGLVTGKYDDSIADYDSIYELLSRITEWNPEVVYEADLDILGQLQTDLRMKNQDKEDIYYDLQNAKDFLNESTGFTREMEEQKVRLESIGLFEKLDFDSRKCPFCSNVLEEPVIELDMMRESIIELDKNISAVNIERPKLRKYINNLETKMQSIKEEISLTEAEIDGIYSTKSEATQIRDLNSRRARVVGRISLWLESVRSKSEDGINLEIIKQIQSRLDDINRILDKTELNERMLSVLSRISVDMTEWSRELELEHSENPYRLDMGKCTVVVDKADRPVPLKQLGSGSNWVGVHLITYFGLQKHFLSASRPVPSFMFLDQPSQVYFPSEVDDNQVDIEMVSKMYDFMANRTDFHSGDLQVIVVDHVNLENKSFRNRITENWWNNGELIPEDWL